jgi:hypothetical protein
MKGIVKLKPIDIPKEGMKVIWGDGKLNPITIDKIIQTNVEFNGSKDLVTLEICWMLPFSLSELQQLVVEYRCPSIKREGESCPKNNNCKYPECSILPIPEDDWERNIEGVGQEVEFNIHQECPYEFTSRCTQGNCDCKIFARLNAKLTPSPILYTEEEVKLNIYKYIVDKAGFVPDKLQSLIIEWWNKNKKK